MHMAILEEENGKIQGCIEGQKQIGKLGAISKNGEISLEGIKSVMAVIAPSELIATPLQGYTKFLNLKYLELAHKELGIRH